MGNKSYWVMEFKGANGLYIGQYNRIMNLLSGIDTAIKFHDKISAETTLGTLEIYCERGVSIKDRYHVTEHMDVE